MRNLLRAPGRTVLGAAGLALGVAAFTVLLSLTLAFRGEVAGSLLGNAVVAQARTANYLSVALFPLLGAAGAVDVLVLSQRERAADLAVLSATGWSRCELGRLALCEGARLGLLGGLTGAVAGLATVLMIGQGLWEGRLLTMTGAALLAALVAVGLVCAVLSIPIRAMSRIAPASLFAREWAAANRAYATPPSSSPFRIDDGFSRRDSAQEPLVGSAYSRGTPPSRPRWLD
jgi:ABC-type lipoprotein release transport system permease subunit